MRKITFCIISLFSLLVTTSFAASGVTAKNDVSTPYYNSGLGFGLAGYYSTQKTTPDVNNGSGQSLMGSEHPSQTHTQLVYR